MHGSGTNDRGLMILEAAGQICLAPQWKLEKGEYVEENHPRVEALGLTYIWNEYVSKQHAGLQHNRDCWVTPQVLEEGHFVMGWKELSLPNANTHSLGYSEADLGSAEKLSAVSTQCSNFEKYLKVLT